MESTTQSVLCCIGQSVAGNPTQYLMDRAFSTQELDWRAITVEVSDDQFETAIAGMQAMRFRAIRFFPDFELAAANYFAPQSGLGPEVGMTSAKRAADGWQVWNNRGYAIRNAIAESIGWERTESLLIGDGPNVRNYLLARRDLARRDVGTPPEAMTWVDPPEDSATLFGGSDEEQETSPVRLISNGSDLLEQLERVHSADEPPLRIAVIGGDLSALLDCAELLSRVPQIVLVGDGESALELSAELTAEPLCLSEVDLSLAADLYDFHRWTGHTIDSHILRDAYDEYSDF